MRVFKNEKEFLKSQIGKTVNVLFETDKENYSEGYTENYTPVRVYGSNKLVGEIIKVKIIGVEDDSCIAEKR